MTEVKEEEQREDTWTRLRRRKVVQWGIAYTAGAWALLQVTGFVADVFHWPDVIAQIATLILLIGLPVVVVIAWYHGDRGEQRITATEVAILSLLFILAGGIFWRYERANDAAVVAARPATSTASVTDDRSIAVLPFVDMSADKDQEYFADGISEELLNLLTQIPELRVIARTSSFSFKNRAVDIATIAGALHVANVLEGSVRKSGDTLRVTAQLIRTSDSAQLWSQNYDRQLTDVFTVQDEIAGAVVGALRLRLLPAQKITNEYRTANSEAYNQYLLGNHFLNRRTWEGYRRSVAAYEQAIALDPGFAAAYAGFAEANSYVAEMANTAPENAAGKRLALAAADKAVALAPNLASAHAVRGFIRMTFDWDWAGAQADFDRAQTLEPGSGAVQNYYGRLLASLGRLPEAVAASRKATVLDPLSADAWSSLGWEYIAGGRWPEARDALDHALAISPESTHANYYRGILELLLGRANDALTWFGQSGPVFGGAGQAMAEHSLGHAVKAQRTLDELIAKYEHDATYQVAEVCAWRGENDKAIDWLERAYVQRDGGLVYVKFDPLLASLRKDARLAAVVTKLGLPP